jgi:hypothetical protein
MGYTHNKGYSAIDSGFAVGARGAEVQVIDAYGKLNYSTLGPGKAYYVEANAGLDTNDGSSWAKAFKTLTVAMAASHANVAASSTGWANRNLIFYKGDNNEASKETLTTLAQKTDIIGVGSYDGNPYPILIGNHLIVGSFMGCRFFNMGFKSLAAGGIIMSIPTEVSQPEFHGCKFIGNTSTVATIGLATAGVASLKVKNCEFVGKFSTAAIQIGTGAANEMRIEDNIIESGAIGIYINTGMTCAEKRAMILRNTFQVSTFVVQDVATKTVISGCRGSTLSNGSTDETFVYDPDLASDNIISHSGATQAYYPAFAAIPA